MSDQFTIGINAVLGETQAREALANILAEGERVAQKLQEAFRGVGGAIGSSLQGQSQGQATFGSQPTGAGAPVVGPPRPDVPPAPPMQAPRGGGGGGPRGGYTDGDGQMSDEDRWRQRIDRTWYEKTGIAGTRVEMRREDWEGRRQQEEIVQNERQQAQMISAEAKVSNMRSDSSGDAARRDAIQEAALLNQTGNAEAQVSVLKSNPELLQNKARAAVEKSVLMRKAKEQAEQDLGVNRNAASGFSSSEADPAGWNYATMGQFFRYLGYGVVASEALKMGGAAAQYGVDFQMAGGNFGAQFKASQKFEQGFESLPFIGGVYSMASRALSGRNSDEAMVALAQTQETAGIFGMGLHERAAVAEQERASYTAGSRGVAAATSEVEGKRIARENAYQQARQAAIASGKSVYEGQKALVDTLEPDWFDQAIPIGKGAREWKKQSAILDKMKGPSDNYLDPMTAASLHAMKPTAAMTEMDRRKAMHGLQTQEGALRGGLETSGFEADWKFYSAHAAGIRQKAMEGVNANTAPGNNNPRFAAMIAQIGANQEQTYANELISSIGTQQVGWGYGFGLKYQTARETPFQGISAAMHEKSLLQAQVAKHGGIAGGNGLDASKEDIGPGVDSIVKASTALNNLADAATRLTGALSGPRTGTD